MHDTETDTPSPFDETIPLLGPIVKLQIGAQAFFLAMLFGAVTTSTLTYSLLGGFLGANAVLIHSILLAFIAVQYTWLRNSALYRPLLKGIEESPQVRADRWVRFAFLLVFLVCINVFVTSLRGYSHWGVVSGHDSPQYYAYLHSWVFDQDLNFENELKAIPGVWELMNDAHPERPEYNVAPIGTAVVWLPFYLAGHVLMVLLSGMGFEVPTNGISSPYAMAAAFGSHFAVFVGMLLLYRSLRNWFATRTAFFATLLVWLASPLIWYLTDQPWMSHACSFFAAALVLWLWLRNRENRHWSGWTLLGAAIGLAMLVRPSHVVLLVLPIADLVLAAKEKRSIGSSVGGVALAVAATLVVFTWQLATWWLRYGTEPPPGSPMQWAQPAISQILFSAHHGLFALHPVLVFGFIGIIPLWRRARGVAICMAILLAAYVYMNAAIASWFGGGSFGMRRFVGVLPFMAPGIAAFGAWFIAFSRKRPAVPVAAVVLMLTIYNATLVIQYRQGWSHFLRPVPFQQIWSSSAAIFHDTFGNPFSYPANLWFAFKHDVSPSQYDVALGVPPDAELDVQGVSLKPYLGKGWQKNIRFASLLNGAFPAEDFESRLFIYGIEGHAYHVGLSMSLPNEMQHDQFVGFAFNGEPIGSATLEPGRQSELTLSVPGNLTKDGLNTLTLYFENRIEKEREGSQTGTEGYGLEMKTRRKYPACALLWRLRVATDYGDGVPWQTEEQPSPQSE
ncbi:MAG: hypothetical protein AMXMBFR82_45470 [Candidatus Hydrogenedentota bacterium]